MLWGAPRPVRRGGLYPHVRSGSSPRPDTHPRPQLRWEVTPGARPSRSCHLRAHAPLEPPAPTPAGEEGCVPVPTTGTGCVGSLGASLRMQQALGPPGPGPSSSVAVAFADLAWPSLPRLDLRFCMWVDWAEPVVVWTCVRPPQVDQPQVDQPCDLGAPSAGRAVSWAAPGKCVAWWLSASEVLPWSSPSLVLWLPGSRQRWPAAARWPSSLETLGAEQGGKTVPCPLSGSGRGQCAHSDRHGGQLLAPLHSRLRAPSLPLKQVQQSWGALTVGDFIS